MWYRVDMSRRDERNSDVGLEAGVRFSMGFLRPRPHHHDITSVKQLMLTRLLSCLSLPHFMATHCAWSFRLNC